MDCSGLTSVTILNPNLNVYWAFWHCPITFSNRQELIVK
jgi:hypothetical protein